MWGLTIWAAGLLATALWLSFRRGALRREERLTSALVLDSERSILIGLISTFGAFLIFPHVGWYYLAAAALGGVVLGLALGRRYAARAQRKLSFHERLPEPHGVKPVRWSWGWWLLLFACLGLLALSFVRTPLVPYRYSSPACLIVGGIMLAEGLYLRLWARGRRAMPPAAR